MTTELKADVVLEGGGVKGIGLVGALEVAESLGYTWARVAGTSAGAIVAALLAAGYSAKEIKTDVMDHLDYRKFQDRDIIDRVPIIGSVISLGIEKGIYEGAYLQDLMTDLLAKKGVHTFGDLKIADAEDDLYRYKLQVIVSDVSRGRMTILPRHASLYGLDPDRLSVAHAVRMSMSIPFFFEPVQLRDERSGEDNCIVDGGMLSNYPIWLFDCRGRKPRFPTFGLRLSGESSRTEEGKSMVRHAVKGPISLLAAMFFTAMEAHDRRHVEEEDWVRTIPIPTVGVKATDFDLSRDDADRLYLAGQQAAQEFFETWNFEEYVEEYRTE